MDNLTIKSKIVYKVLEKLEADCEKRKTNAYNILDYLIENAEEIKNEFDPQDETQIIDFSIEATIKGVNTIITSLAKKDLVIKTDPENIQINGTTRYLRSYFLKK